MDQPAQARGISGRRTCSCPPALAETRRRAAVPVGARRGAQAWACLRHQDDSGRAHGLAPWLSFWQGTRGCGAGTPLPGRARSALLRVRQCAQKAHQAAYLVPTRVTIFDMTQAAGEVSFLRGRDRHASRAVSWRIPCCARAHALHALLRCSSCLSCHIFLLISPTESP